MPDAQLPDTSATSHTRTDAKKSGAAACAAEALETGFSRLTAAIGFCAAKNIKMDECRLGELLELRQKYIDNNNLTPEEEKKFWTIYQDFAGCLNISVSSVIWNKKYRFLILLLSGILGLSMLGGVLWKQMEWADLQSHVVEIQTLNKYIDENTPKYFDLDTKVKSLEGDIKNNEDYENLLLLKGQLGEKQSALMAQYDILERTDGINQCLSLNNPTTSTVEEDERNNIMLDAKKYNYCVFSVVRSKINKLSTYWLPVMYGLLGTIAYMLREISSQVRRETLNELSVLEALVRIPLGMLAGLAVGFLLDTASLTGLAAITPLALSFVAGYSIELVFSAMDRIVGAFSGGSRATEASPPTPPPARNQTTPPAQAAPTATAQGAPQAATGATN